jgi:uncharacterized protein (TIGR03000 family)
VFAAALALVVFTTSAEAQWRGGRGWRGGWYGGMGYGYGSGYYGGYYGSYNRPYGGWYSPYSGSNYSPYYYGGSGYSAIPYTGYSYGPAMTNYAMTAGTYAANPQTQTYQSFYSPPSNDRLSLRILVPAPDARVLVDNTLTDRQGTDRYFVSPPLTPGQQYTYTIRASWMQNGREVTRQKVLTFTPGQQLTVNFADTRDTSITDVTGTDGTQPAPGTAAPAGATPDRRPDQSTTGTPGTPPPPPKPGSR